MFVDDTRPRTNRERIVVGLSGGVDSSVAAALLNQHGAQLTGLFMKNWEEDDDEHCSAAQDLADATSVANALGIPLRTVNFATEYWDRVFATFLAEHEAGRTPNPDILCNREIKFKEFVDHAHSLGADTVATGHYVRRAQRDGYIALMRGADAGKDQSYFLHALGQDALAVARFPVGALRKPEVRTHARQLRLQTQDKRDSTGICFIGERPFREFLERYVARNPGPIVAPDGHQVGTHQGLPFYTIGQRRGLGIGGSAGDSGEAWYVYAKHMDTNVLGVVQGHDDPLLFADGLRACEFNWIAGRAPAQSFRATIKTRYRQKDIPCHVEPTSDGTIEVRFDHPSRAVTPGQSAVLYCGQECLGGGVITHVHKDEQLPVHG
jgi:tRNA-uridine 2-sulfurtransferase